MRKWAEVVGNSRSPGPQRDQRARRLCKSQTRGGMRTQRSFSSRLLSTDCSSTPGTVSAPEAVTAKRADTATALPA